MTSTISRTADNAGAAAGTTAGTTAGAVDPGRWPDVAAVPAARVRAAVASALLRRIAGRVAVRIVFPGGRVLGDAGPVLHVRRPEAFLARLGAGGLIGFGEAYQAGDWDADDLVGLLTVLAADLPALVPPRLQWLRRFHGARAPGPDANTRDGARRNIERHYDLSNDLFALFLDPSMTYSAGLFEDPATASSADLEAAQHRKIDRLLDRTGVGPGSRLLEIGTGWGELAIRAARRGASVVTVTLSRQQQVLAERRAAAAGVGHRVEVRLRDYRELPGTGERYDAIVSVEMIEAIGARLWPDYVAALDRLLAPGGRVGLQAITMPHQRMLATRDTYTWIQKYVFPGGLLPSETALDEALAGHSRLAVLDRCSFGPHYATTLRLWRERFTAQAAQVAALGFDATFQRTWLLYLAYCEAGFAAGYLDVCQLILGRTERTA